MNRTIKTCAALFITLLIGITSCSGLDDCDPPFSVGSVLSQKSIRAGDKFWLEVIPEATSVTQLDNISITITIPKEVEIRSISQPKGGPEISQNKQIITWIGNRKRTLLDSLLARQFEKKYYLFLTSKTDWGKWSEPITVHVELAFKVGDGMTCSNFPNGFYSKTMKWSHKESYDPPNWEVAPNGYRGIWK